MSGTYPDVPLDIPYGVLGPQPNLVVNVMDWGAIGDGEIDDTDAIQAAADEIEDAGGGCLFFPPNRAFLFSSTVFIPARTWVRGGGWSTVLTAIAGANWTLNTVGTSSYTNGSFRTLFANKNWQSDTITDTDIIFSDFAADLDTSASVQRKALASMISTRNTQFSRILTRGGGGVISHLHSDNSQVRDSTFLDFHSTATDHYSGFTDAQVVNNYFRQLAVSSSNPAVQFTGTNNNNTNNTSSGVICMGNKVYITGSAITSVGAVSITASGTGGVVNDVIIADNQIDCGSRPVGGIICYGGGDDWKIHHNAIQNVADYNTLLVFANGYGTITRPSVTSNRLLDCTRTSGGATLISVQADKSTVLDNDVLDCTATKAMEIVGSNCVFRSGTITGGTITTRMSVTGSNNSVLDNDTTNARSLFSQDVVSSTGFRIGTSGSLLDNYTVAGSWTPTLQFGGGVTGITYSTRTGTYWRIGKMVYVRCVLVLTSKGSDVGTAQITGAPITAGTGPVAWFGVVSWPNFNTITAPPVVRISSTTFTLAVQVGTGATNLDNTHFANNTNLTFEGWYPTT